MLLLVALLPPGMYIGSSDPHEVHGVAWHAKKQSLQPASMEIVPGLLKLFDEILVRALGPGHHSPIHPPVLPSTSSHTAHIAYSHR